MTVTKSWYRDAVERVLWTFLQGAAAEVLVSGSFNETTWKVAAVAGGLSVAKCLVAMGIGSPNTAATLPEEDDTPNG